MRRFGKPSGDILFEQGEGTELQPALVDRIEITVACREAVICQEHIPRGKAFLFGKGIEILHWINMLSFLRDFVVHADDVKIIISFELVQDIFDNRPRGNGQHIKKTSVLKVEKRTEFFEKDFSNRYGYDKINVVLKTTYYGKEDDIIEL